VRTVRLDPMVAVIAQVLLLAGLTVRPGLGAVGWLVGLACTLVTNALLTRALERSGAARLGPASRVTLTRATLVGAVAALVAQARHGGLPVLVVTLLASVALALDAVDGWLARRTNTVTALGARFDMEVDAFLILVLSLAAARDVGGWVLAIGLMRYAYVAASWWLPWLRDPVPPRYWRKVVAAIQGVTLAVVVSGVLTAVLGALALVVALALLVESFGRDVWWQWRGRRITRPAAEPAAVAVPARRRPVRAVVRVAVTVLGAALVWAALVAPDELRQVHLASFARVPLEGLALAALVLVVPWRAGRVLAVAAGTLLGALVLLKLFDMGFIEALDRPFNPVTDRGYLGPAYGVLRDSVGGTGAVLVTAGIVLVVTALIAALAVAVLRLARLGHRHRGGAVRVLAVLAAVWLVGSGVGAPVTATNAAALAAGQSQQVVIGLRDQREFDRAAAVDQFRDTPGTDLLTGLRGKDVVIAFVESYGRVAVQDSSFSPQVDSVLDSGTQQLKAAGYASRSAFLTSPTFGGISWLAHSTLQSGVWISNQRRYDRLMGSGRFTLSDAFGRAGWRTVGDVPSNWGDWAQGHSFYHYDQLYSADNVGYQGPKFSYANMPDQYVLDAFRRLELAPANRGPVMAEIDLVSSHTPWAPLPKPVAWSALGDGSVFAGMDKQGSQPAQVWSDPAQVRAAYGQSVQYTMGMLVSWLRTFPDPNLVLVVLGDHQPATIVTGPGASHDVPISIISPDPTVIDHISGWGWQDGLHPMPDAPVWGMDSFRDRFLTAFGSAPAGAPPAAAPAHR
jgi:phosphatidylglycerophosphate synthase